MKTHVAAACALALGAPLAAVPVARPPAIARVDGEAPVDRRGARVRAGAVVSLFRGGGVDRVPVLSGELGG
jgi:hypothetical protein